MVSLLQCPFLSHVPKVMFGYWGFPFHHQMGGKKSICQVWDWPQNTQGGWGWEGHVRSNGTQGQRFSGLTCASSNGDRPMPREEANTRPGNCSNQIDLWKGGKKNPTQIISFPLSYQAVHLIFECRDVSAYPFNAEQLKFCILPRKQNQRHIGEKLILL